jgi:S1-C subfamily serine protease
MKQFLRALGLAWLACIIVCAPALAEEWATTGSANGSVWDVDVATLEVKQEVVKSWMRETMARPRRDENNHKPYVVMLTQRSDDCARRKYAMGAFVRRNQAGEVVSQAMGATGWQEIVPGTVAEGYWRTVCAAARPPNEPAFLKSISAGPWRSLGQAANRKFALSVLNDDIIKLDATHVGSYIRSDYAQPEPIDGFGVRHTVVASIVDCVNEKTASLGIDLYVSPTLRVKSVRIARKDLQFEPITPSSFLANSLRDLCAAARPVKAKAPATEKKDEPKYYTGTAWGAEKGYLVTAAHVIENAKTIAVYRDGDKVGEAKVVVADFANDLAILAFTKAPPGKLKTLPLASHAAVLGRSVFSLGYPAPGVLGQQVKMTSGQINSTSGMQDDTRMLQISIPLQGGNSGGPVMTWDGQVVGVVDLKLRHFEEGDDEAPQNVNYAVKTSYVRPMFDSLPDLGNHEAVKIAATQEKTIAAVRQAVFMLLVAQ